MDESLPGAPNLSGAAELERERRRATANAFGVGMLVGGALLMVAAGFGLNKGLLLFGMIVAAVWVWKR